ncbi:DNA glycosylase AlkZ-like family protein [Actinomyces slackii]|uniref:Winged helix DNA-binding domain-containing protein n=1 Tax=Actinomyces slackii TaxID=52774 RepID=A0A448KCD0_9ACTO|nr:crosslink repair DNA glycosylase YcaQ family protein [Actinomyces slackii]VEG74540.1 Uncharacterised protein [Actinomyces slackii]
MAARPTRPARPARPAPAAEPLPREVSLARIVAQGLVPATAAPDPVEAVRRQLAIQGQQVSAIPHAIASRTGEAVGMPQIDEAFGAGGLVRSWPMRGTVHITTAADYHWMREALLHRMASWMRADEERFGHGSAGLERAASAAWQAIERAADQGRPGCTRAELIEAWQAEGVLPDLIAAGADDSYAKRHLIVGLHAVGALVQGPRSGGEHLVIDARRLPDTRTGPGGSGGAAQGQEGHRAALAEIARRYATSHGPVSAADLSRWTTMPKREAARALQDAVEMTNAEGYAADPASGAVPLARGLATGGARGSLELMEPGGTVPRGAETLYLRADLPDLLAAHRAQAERTRFLASFDELHVGYKDRSCLTDAAGERLICPSMNGMFRPILVDRGRVVAVRPVGAGLIWADSARRSARLERDVERAVRAVEERLAR